MAVVSICMHVNADALHVCPMASGFGFADHVIIIIIMQKAIHSTEVCLGITVPVCEHAGCGIPSYFLTQQKVTMILEFPLGLPNPDLALEDCLFMYCPP